MAGTGFGAGGVFLAGSVFFGAGVVFFGAGVDFFCGAGVDFFCGAGADFFLGAGVDFFRGAGVDFFFGAGAAFFFTGAGAAFFLELVDDDFFFESLESRARRISFWTRARARRSISKSWAVSSEVCGRAGLAASPASVGWLRCVAKNAAAMTTNKMAANAYHLARQKRGFDAIPPPSVRVEIPKFSKA